MADINCAWLVGGFCVIFGAMGYGYKIHVDKKHIKLEKQDKEQKQRITKIEEKNGNEQHQIDELKESNKELKKELAEEKKDKNELKDLVIKLQDRIISCEKSNGKDKTKLT